MTFIYCRFDITLHFLFLPGANSVPLNTKTHKSFSPMFQWKRSPEPCIHSILYKLNLECNEQCTWILISDSLYSIYSLKVILPCPSMKIWKVLGLFSLFLDHLHSCCHLKNQYCHHLLKQFLVQCYIKNL